MRATFWSAPRRARRRRAWPLGALAKLLLREFGCEILSHVIAVGHARLERAAAWSEIAAVCANLDSPLRCVDPETEARMKQEVDQVLRAGDTVGGIFEVVAHGVPPGLGSHAQWDAQARRPAGAGGDVHPGGEGGGDRRAAWPRPLPTAAKCRTRSATMQRSHRFVRPSNRAGGLEGGITNGEDVVVRGYLKPISTLRRALGTADLVTKAAGAGRLRAFRRVRGSGRRRGRRSDGGAGAGGRIPGKIWRRLAGRDAPQLRRLPTATR